MKKDINFLPVKNVLLAIAEDEGGQWNVYLINKNNTPLTNVMVTSKGYGKIDDRKKETSTLRHMFEKVAPFEYIVIEPIQEELFKLTNEFLVSYFIDNQIYDKKYVFVAGSLESRNIQKIEEIGCKGVLHP